MKRNWESFRTLQKDLAFKLWAQKTIVLKDYNIFFNKIIKNPTARERGAYPGTKGI